MERQSTIVIAVLLFSALTLSGVSAEKMPAMIRVIAQFDITPEQRDVFAEALRVARTGTSWEAGSLGYRVYVDKNDASRFFVDERYNSEEAVTHHQAQDYIKAIGELAPSVLAAPPVVYILGAPLLREAEIRQTDTENKNTETTRLFSLFSISENEGNNVIEPLGVHIQQALEISENILYDAFSLSNDDRKIFVEELWREQLTNTQMNLADELRELLANSSDRKLSANTFTVVELD